MTMQNLRDRETLLGFDFVARIVDALNDVLQNAFEVMRLVTALWGLDKLERLAPNYQAGSLSGWYFPLAQSLWPTWAARPIDEIAGILLGDALLVYLDNADVVLAVSERTLEEFDSNAARTMLMVKLSFSPGADGQSHAVLTIPSLYRFQELSAVYLKGMPLDVPSVEARVKDARITIVGGADGYLHCSAELEEPEFGGMTFGSDGGLSGEAPIFALERDCLASASAGNQPIEFICRSANAAFEVDCILRLAGFSNPAG